MSSGLETNIFHHSALITLPVRCLFDQKSPKIGNFMIFPSILTDFLPFGSIVDHQLADRATCGIALMSDILEH